MDNPNLEARIDRLTRALERHDNLFWLIGRGIVGAIASTLGVIFVLTVGVWLLRELGLIPGLNVFIDELMRTVEQYKEIRGLR